mmetsp:Transcript_90215/g.160687  ORF Transcript_90215/g.160687 Transcript_90215/m.160687 type:complete len:83 (+) Transcript_90215:375-623(+)
MRNRQGDAASAAACQGKWQPIGVRADASVPTQDFGEVAGIIAAPATGVLVEASPEAVGVEPGTRMEASPQCPGLGAAGEVHP